MPRAGSNMRRLINDSGRHLLSVVNGILDMSKMETGNFEITPEPFAPAPAIESCRDLLALKARDCRRRAQDCASRPTCPTLRPIAAPSTRS